MYRYSKYFFLATVLASVGSVACATKDLQSDASAIDKATVSLAQALTQAEQHAHGRATRAELEWTQQGPVYDVEVVGGGKVFDARVDAVKGSVTSLVEDAVDHDDDHDAQD
jgi:uncharacterized membrane protein YkoI